MVEVLNLATPTNLTAGDDDAYVLGVEFDSTEDGQAFSGVRWFPPADVFTDGSFHYYAVACTVADSQVVESILIEPEPGDEAGFQNFYFTAPHTMSTAGTRYVAGILLKRYAFTPASPNPWPQGSVPDGFLTGYQSRLTGSAPPADTPTFPAVTTNLDFGISPIVGIPDDGPEEHDGTAALGISFTIAATGRKVTGGTAAIQLSLDTGRSGAKHGTGTASVGLELSTSVSSRKRGRGTSTLSIVLSAQRGPGVKSAFGAAALGLALRIQIGALARLRPGRPRADARTARWVAGGRPTSTLTPDGGPPE